MIALVGAFVVGPSSAFAQGWGDEDDGWSAPDSSSESTPYSPYSESRFDSANPPQTPWSFRAGLGFTVDPDDFLLNFELPYRLDQYVSVGPMMQVGLEEDRYIVAPTLNLTLSMPDMPGENFDRFSPNIFAGIGFAVIENDDRGGDTRATGFLINTGFGVDYRISGRLSIGSRMILNFLPGGTLDEKFFYTWEVAGLKVSF